MAVMPGENLSTNVFKIYNMKKAQIKSSVLLGLVFGLSFGLILAIWNSVPYALTAGIVLGIVFGIKMYFFVTSKTVNEQTQIEDVNGNTIIRSGGANHFVRGEAVGGKLYLLIDEIHFKSHNFNIQNHEQIIRMDQIRDVKFFNPLGFLPNGLVISTNEGKKEKFVVNDRKFWKEDIEKLRQRIIAE